jgi:hypothetical protein
MREVPLQDLWGKSTLDGRSNLIRHHVFIDKFHEVNSLTRLST